MLPDKDTRSTPLAYVKPEQKNIREPGGQLVCTIIKSHTYASRRVRFSMDATQVTPEVVYYHADALACYIIRELKQNSKNQIRRISPSVQDRTACAHVKESL